MYFIVIWQSCSTFLFLLCFIINDKPKVFSCWKFSWPENRQVQQLDSSTLPRFCNRCSTSFSVNLLASSFHDNILTLWMAHAMISITCLSLVQRRLRAWRSSIDFRLCIHIFLPYSRNLLMRLCNVNDEIFNVFTTICNFCILVNLWPSLLLRISLSLSLISVRCSLYTQSCYCPVANYLQNVPPVLCFCVPRILATFTLWLDWLKYISPALETIFSS